MWKVPGYAEVDRLGAGSQGEVVVARSERSGQLVAVKYLATAGPQAEHEARLLMRLGGDHVVRLLDYVPQPAGPGAALVMEFLRGADLAALLTRFGALAPEGALAVLKGSLLGLAEAHAVGVVHRDYKPANVLVQDNGDSKLLDFGIAVASGQAGRAGTPLYQAPEQWAGTPASAATDVYAATCVFYECVTGRPPYQAANITGLHYLHSSAPIPTDDLPEPLRPLLRTGMAKSAADRPVDAQAFVAQLEAVAVAAYGPDWESRARRGLGMAAASLIAAGLAHLGGAAAGGATGAGASAAGTTSLATTRLLPSWLLKAGAVLGAAAAVGAGVYVVRSTTAGHSKTKTVAADSGCAYKGSVAGQLPARPDVPANETAFVSTKTGTIKVALSAAAPCTSGSFTYSANHGVYANSRCDLLRARDGQLQALRCTTTGQPGLTFRPENLASASPASNGCVLTAGRTGNQPAAPSTNSSFVFFCGDYTAHFPKVPVFGTVTAGANLLPPKSPLPLTIGTIFVGVPGTTAPTLGRVWASNQNGYGEVMPWTFYAGGDPTGLVSSVTWTSWGGPTATGTGTAEYVGPNQVVANGTERPVTVTASRLGTCQGQLMYQQVNWTFPGVSSPETAGFNNICTGGA